MKKFLITAAAALAAIGASAQSYLLNNPSNTSYFGIRASYDMTCPGKMKTDLGKTKVLGIGSGASLGIVYNQPLVANLYIEPGVTFYYHTESIEPEYLSSIAKKTFQNRSLRKFGAEVPVMFGYHFDFTPSVSLSVMTGPVLNVGISNDYYITTKEVAGHKFHTSGTMYNDYGMNRVGCDWRFGAGLTFSGTYYVAVTGDVGMCNMLKDTNANASLRENGVKFTLGYNF